MAMKDNFKGELFQYCAKNKKNRPKFLNSSNGPPHDLRFTSQVFIDDRLVGEGKGKSKKEAEHRASKAALEFMGYRETGELPDILPDESGSEYCSLSGSTGDTSLDRSTGENGANQLAAVSRSLLLQHDYISILHKICQKKRWTCNFLEETVGEKPHMFQFTCKASIEDINYPESNPQKTKQLAKKEAAFLALKKLKSEYATEVQALLDINVDEYINGNSSTSSLANVGQNKTCAESGLASSATNTSLTVSFRDSCSALSGAQRIMPSPVDPLREFDDITEIDAGAYGKVMKAKKKLDDVYYAVKKIHMKTKDIDRYREEVKVLARLNHPNIVRYFNAWLAEEPVGISDSSESSSSAGDLDKKYLFIQMELCDKGSLKKWLKKRKNIETHQSLCFFRQFIEAVKYIHSQKLIHRDLKPANIFFTKDMVVKIGDFGLVAHMTGEDESEARQRTQGTGTPSYMAPEQKDGNKYENEVDIYALGLILFELLYIFDTGHERANNWDNIREGCLPPDFVQQYPFEECTIKKMLSKDPKKRPSANELIMFFDANEIHESRTQ